MTEPTPAGIHDLERVMALTNHFRIRATVVVNKCDINPSSSAAIKNYCDAGGHTLLGEIPYETAITEAQRAGKAIVDYDPACGGIVPLGRGISRATLHKSENTGP